MNDSPSINEKIKQCKSCKSENEKDFSKRQTKLLKKIMSFNHKFCVSPQLKNAVLVPPHSQFTVSGQHSGKNILRA